MVRPNFIPRTLIGVGGVRLFDIPGVIYPDEMLRPQPGAKKTDGKPYSTPPSWGISSAEAAAILGCTVSAARLMLHKRKVNFRIVSDGQVRRLYWRKSKVEEIAAEQLPEMRQESPLLVNTKQASDILGVGRSTLQRYVQQGKLKGINVRYILPDGCGARRRTYFEKAAVYKLAHRLEAKRRHAEELDELLQECDRSFDSTQKVEKSTSKP